ncbi:LacI family DNA-binding transcriptional regulator [Devosia sp. ZW T5_3]|uniref:LacI family DNA-binding transcriptional regulator n=1 Tax=Devosia sp. ZW T5_3 TaxID=3378085 RepID=UPI003853CCB5
MTLQKAQPNKNKNNERMCLRARAMKRVTIQQIADHLGISKFAVSRALSGKPGVSEPTRHLIVDTAAALGYNARRQGAGQNIEVIFKNRATASRELWVDVQNGIDHEATAHGCVMSVRWLDDPAELPRIENGAIGYILVGPQTPAMLETALSSALPAVVVNHIVPPLWQKDQVSAADVEAGVYVAHHLQSLGHRRVVYAHGRLGYPGRLARLAGFADAIAEVEDMELREIGFSDDRAAGDLREAVTAMAAAGFEPTAFFCGSDIVAVTVVSELMRLGLRIPEDVSVVGHADYAIATQISPQLTTVHMPHREMGIAAVRVLLSRAGQSPFMNELPPQRINLVPHLVERQSSGPASHESWRHRLRGAPSSA